MRRTAITVIACLAALAATVAPAFAASNGMLAAVADGKLVTLNPDGSGLRTIWTPPAGSGDITALAWSPDGNKLALTYGDKLVVWDLVAGSGKTLPPDGDRDLNPAWSADGSQIAFRRVGSLTQSRATVKADLTALHTTPLLDSIAQLAFSPDLTRTAIITPAKWLLITDVAGGLELTRGAVGVPAWSANGEKVAYVDDGTTRPAGLWVTTTEPQGSINGRVTSDAAGSPRWSPDGSKIAYVGGGVIKLVRAAQDSQPTSVPGTAGVTGVDWQPCVPGAYADCVSYAPPTCSPTSLTLTTQSDEPKELPLPSCVNPGGLPLAYSITKLPASGTMSGMTYTPAPGFVGQDEVVYRAAHRFGESEPITVRIFVVRRAVQSSPPPPQPDGVAPQVAPYLTARATPRLDRKRTTLVRLSCDQNCAFTVRLTGVLKKPRKTLRSKVVKKSAGAGVVLSVRLRLSKKPKGKFKSLFITGTVRNGAGQKRAVKLPVRLPR
jgi:dipeptidyl aminopeptidase/acylaminoacyl peptidase